MDPCGSNAWIIVQPVCVLICAFDPHGCALQGRRRTYRGHDCHLAPWSRECGPPMYTWIGGAVECKGTNPSMQPVNAYFSSPSCRHSAAAGSKWRASVSLLGAPTASQSLSCCPGPLYAFLALPRLLQDCRVSPSYLPPSAMGDSVRIEWGRSR